jgi:hypothetical protein
MFHRDFILSPRSVSGLPCAIIHLLIPGNELPEYAAVPYGPFRAYSGRWLWDEEQQLCDRVSPFDVIELQKVAASIVEANKYVEITKLAEGSFNKILSLRWITE